MELPLEIYISTSMVILFKPVNFRQYLICLREEYLIAATY